MKLNSMGDLTTNEQILKECEILYNDKDKGLIKAAKLLDLTVLPPRKKIVTMLIGNHSAGKSSFINWYINDPVQRTGVAIETQGFVLVTSGKKRDTLTGNAILHLYPHFKPLEKIKVLPPMRAVPYLLQNGINVFRPLGHLQSQITINIYQDYYKILKRKEIVQQLSCLKK